MASVVAILVFLAGLVGWVFLVTRWARQGVEAAETVDDELEEIRGELRELDYEIKNTKVWVSEVESKVRQEEDRPQAREDEGEEE